MLGCQTELKPFGNAEQPAFMVISIAQSCLVYEFLLERDLLVLKCCSIWRVAYKGLLLLPSMFLEVRHIPSY